MVTRWWSYGSTPVFNQSKDIFNVMFLIISSSEAASIQSCHCIFSDLHWQNSFLSGRSETGFFILPISFETTFTTSTKNCFHPIGRFLTLAKQKTQLNPMCARTSCLQHSIIYFCRGLLTLKRIFIEWHPTNNHWIKKSLSLIEVKTIQIIGLTIG